MRCILIAVLTLSLTALAGGQTTPPPRRPLTVEDLWKVRRLGPPSVSPDGQWAVVALTSYDVKANDSTSDLWLLATDGKTQKQLTSAGKSSSPKWSPDGKRIAFLAKRGGDEGAQIYVLSPTGGEARRVSNMAMAPSAIKWGPDSQTIYCIGWTWADAPDDAAYHKKDKELKDSKVKAYVIDDALFRYWDTWLADGKRPVIFAVDVATGKHNNVLAGTGLHLPPTEPSTSDYDVSPDGKEICFVADSLKKPGIDNNPDLFTLSLDGKGKPKNVTTDNEGSDTSPAYSPDGKWIAYTRSEIKHFSTDCQRLMLLDRAEGKSRSLTASLDRGCTGPRWLPDGKRIAVQVEDAGYATVYFVNAETGKVIPDQSKVTEQSIDFAKTIRLGVFLRTSFNLPPTVFSHRPGEKEPRQISFFNDDLVSQWQLGKVDNVTFPGADDAKVQMFVFYPPNFDANKKWPLVHVVHGGPHVGVTSAFSFRWNPQLWAAQGYVVAVVNFHGSSGFGKAFADSITGDFGTKPGLDILKATDWFEKQPWIDKKRMACAGASYGGYMMAWLNGHTDRFQAMVCHAGVYSYHSQMASDVVYGRERSLGAFPWNDLAKIDKQSAQRYAKNFKTPTLILHGERDFRVPVTHGLEYFMTLKLKGVPTRLVYFPDENHWILKPQNSLLWHKEVFAWLDKYVGKGPTATSTPAPGGSAPGGGSSR